MMRRFAFLLLGIFVAMLLQRLLEEQRESPVPLTSTGPSPARKPTLSPDPLTEINGIGPAFEQALNALGIRTFAALARQDPDDLARRLAARITAERIRRDGWIEQARARSGQ